MAAYASVICLIQTLERFRSQPRILLPQLQTDSIYKDLCYLAYFLEKITSRQSSKRVDALGREIKELVEKLEDLIVSGMSDQFLTGSSGDESLTVIFSQLLLQVIEELDLFTKALMIDDAFEYYTVEAQLQQASFSVADVVSSRVDFGVMTEMVGMDRPFEVTRDLLVHGTQAELIIYPLVGMAGIGKTAFAKKIFQEPDVADKYTRLFLPIGPQYQFKKCLLLALDQVGYNIDELLCEKEENLARYLREVLYHKRSLIVLDDVWDTQVWDDLKPCFPDNNNGSRIILTTRRLVVGRYADIGCYFFPFMNDDESWDLLSKIVFTEEESSCRLDHQLEKLGKKIAKNCEGLPLAIIEIGKLLRKADKTVEYWKKVAEDENPLNIRADDDTPISKTISLSYDHLPLQLKMCFLYMGVFPKEYEVTHSKLAKLWISEGIIDPRNIEHEKDNLEQTADHYIHHLFGDSLLIPGKISSLGLYKTYRLHFVYRPLCVSKACNEKFFHVIKKYTNSFPQGINTQRRLCFHNNIVICFKQVQSSLQSVSGTRSLLFFGKQDQQPSRVYLGYRLLRVLDALTIRFYEFPHQVVELFHLRYLAITYGGREIPPSISRLWNLEVLIVYPHQFTKYLDGPMFLPLEIWKLHKLKHVKCVGFDLPDPSSDNDYSLVLLEQLLTLSGVSAHSCIKGVLARLPNLLKLGVKIARGLISDAAVETSFDFFGDVAHLCGRIESFNCIIQNFDRVSRVVSSIPDFPVNVRKINLSGCGIRWECMEYIGRLPNLVALKLQLYAFRGSKWETVEGGFQKLKFLQLEDLDIEHWRIDDSGHFPSLLYVFISHCYNLREIPCKLVDIPTLQFMKVCDCSPRAYQRLREHVEKFRDSNYFELRILSSWDEKKPEWSNREFHLLLEM